MVALQNLSEFFVVVTRKVQRPLSVSNARTIIADILRSSRWLVIDRQIGTMLRAIDLVEETGAPYWDALIATCMLENGINNIVTENERDFKRIPGLKVIDPFPKRVKR